MSNLSLEEIKRQLSVLVRIGKMTQQQADDRLQELTAQKSKQPRANANPRQHNNHNARPRQRYNGKMSAPYRFVDLFAKIAPAQNGDKPIDISTPLPEGFCATIEAKWVVESPLLIGAEPQNGGPTGPIKMGDDYIIPGSSLKGMTRAALEIIAFARLSPFNDHKYGLRDFDHTIYSSDEPNAYPLSKVNEVKAGWLHETDRKDKDGNPIYTLTPCDWAQVEIDPLLASDVLKDARCYDRLSWVGFQLMRKYSGANMSQGKILNFDTTFPFKSIGEINNKITCNAAANGNISGTPVFSGQAPGRNSKKKFEYVFYNTSDRPLTLTPQEFNQFERVHSKPGKSKLEPDGSWRDLKPTIDAGKRIPVFYVGDPQDSRANDPDNFAMGLTRLFKVPHIFGVKDVVTRTSAKHTDPIMATSPYDVECDFVENLFGFVFEGDQFTKFDDGKTKSLALKGRIAFGFGTFEKQPKLSHEVKTIMMGPRASFAPFYLKGPHKDYSVDEVKTKISGRKRYLPRYTTPDFSKPLTALTEQVTNAAPSIQRNQALQTRLKFLVPTDQDELCFSNTIKMHNVSKEEIGAILWVLTHGVNDGKDRPYRHMLGRAKPFGAGQLRLESLDLQTTPNKPNATTTDHQSCINAFEAYMKQCIGNDWLTTQPMLEFLSLCDPQTGTNLEKQNLLQYITNVQDFANVRKMTKPMKTDIDPLDSDKWDGRYLQTPKNSR